MRRAWIAGVCSMIGTAAVGAPPTAGAGPVEARPGSRASTSAARAENAAARTAISSPNHPPFAWPNPEMISRVEVPGTVRALGVPVRIQVLRLKANIDDLWVTYATAFKQAGFFIPPRAKQQQMAGVPMLTALDPDRRISYSVSLWANPDGTVNAMLGEANLGLRSPEQEGSGFAPVFPGAEGVLVSEQEGARLMTYRAKAKVEEISGFYAETLGRAGFVRDQPSGFRRGQELLDVQVRAEKDAQGGVTVAVVQRASPVEGVSRDPQADPNAEARR